MITTVRSDRKGPCQNCPDRYPACSDHCQKESFLAWKEEQARIRKAKAAYYSPVWAHDQTDKGCYRNSKRRK